MGGATKSLARTWNQDTWPANYMPSKRENKTTTNSLKAALLPDKQNAALLL